MSKKTILVLSALISVGVSQVVLADSGHGDEAKTETGMGGGSSQMDMMGGDMMSMMQRMMQMHGSMMGGGAGQMGMMDRDMMAMMMPGGDPQNAGAHMGVKLREFDADANGSLTLEEFEALHMSATRDRMVDRLQHLDADAEGQITQEDINAAGARMNAMKDMAGGAGAEDHHADDKE